MIRRLLFGWHQAWLLLITLLVLNVIASFNYLFFHTLVELLRVVVLCGVFVLGWHTRRWTNNGVLLIFAIAAGFVGVLELLHALTYKGMGLIFVDNANIPTQLWLSFRYLEALAVLIAALTLGRKVAVRSTFFGFSVITTLLGVSIFTGYFPAAFIEGEGLTPFKIYSEWVMIAVFIIAMVFLLKDKYHLEKDVRLLLAASLFCNALTSLAFTQYASVFDLTNQLGHCLLIVSTYLIYRAILVTGLLTPYELLFVDLKKNEHRLEALVAERTASLHKTQALNSAFIANIPSSISVKDLDNCYTLVNPAFEEMTNQPQGSVLGKTLFDVLPESLAEKMSVSVQHVKKTGVPHTSSETVYVHDDTRHFEMIHFPVKDPEGRLLGSGTIATDVTEQKNNNEQIEFLAHYDLLTGLANKVYFMKQAQLLLDKCTTDACSCALVYFDLDHFKDVNDSLGHEIGDKFLYALAQRLKTLVADKGLLCHYNGDEFLLLLKKVPNKAYIENLVTVLQQQLAEPVGIDSYSLVATSSVGISIYPNDGHDIKTLFQNAGSAMYVVKEDGRNSYQFFEESMQAEAQERLSLLSKLRVALVKNELTVYYQPQYNQAGNKVVGAEALVRWQHPELGFISPARFIPIAEDSGLITVIGEWVLNQACQQAAKMQQAGIEPFMMSVNLSAVQFRKGDLVEVVEKALKNSGLKAEYLDLELTESLLLKDQQRLLQMLQQLKELGVHLSIDDFGTGYSNLSYLKRFAVDKLKIDQSFVRDMESDADDYALVKAIIQLAHSLGLRVTAEGVETLQQVKILAELGCDEFQGYYFARPMPASDFVNHLQAASLTQ